MADDAAAPDGELNESTTPDEHTDAAKAEETTAETAESEITDEDADEADEAGEAGEAAPAKRRMSHVMAATIVGLVLVVALGALTGWLGFRAFESRKADEQRNLYLQVGRQGALNLTSIDWQKADQDVQRILDSATGTFYDDFQQRSQPFVDVVKQAQSKSEGTITEAGLESESADEAQVLVAVTVKTSNAGAAEQQPRAWRMRISVQKVGDEAKVSNVEFVP
jgi:Mce-associated membrane protein